MYIQDNLIEDTLMIKTNENRFFTEFPQFGKFKQDKEYQIIISAIPTALGDENKISTEKNDISNYWYKRYLQVHSMLELLKMNGAKIDFKNISKVVKK